MKKFQGKVLFLDRSDINTDEIIPAKYLTEITKESLKPHLFEDLILDGFNISDICDKNIVVSRTNFGCGSSREHAPWAIEQNGINVVIAEGFARIFRQNMYNCGMLAIELSKDEIEILFNEYQCQDSEITIDIEREIIIVIADNKQKEIKFCLADFDKDLVQTGGWVDYVDKKY